MLSYVCDKNMIYTSEGLFNFFGNVCCIHCDDKTRVRLSSVLLYTELNPTDVTLWSLEPDQYIQGKFKWLARLVTILRELQIPGIYIYILHFSWEWYQQTCVWTLPLACWCNRSWWHTCDRKPEHCVDVSHYFVLLCLCSVAYLYCLKKAAEVHWNQAWQVLLPWSLQ